MKQSNERHTVAGQSNNVQKPRKHDANLRKNSTLYFQIGLIVALFAVYGLFEMKFEKRLPKFEKPLVIVEKDPAFTTDNFKIFEEIQAQKQEPKKERKMLTKAPEVKPNNFKISVPVNIITGPKTTGHIAKISEIKDPGKIESPIDPPININAAEKAPVYPGCERAKTNSERKQCMSEKLSALIQKRFNPNIASELGLSGIQKINVRFTIDKTGNIIDIKTKAPNVQLEKEALRVAKKIPTMKPGLQRAKPVSVIYNLPILLKVQ